MSLEEITTEAFRKKFGTLFRIRGRACTAALKVDTFRIPMDELLRHLGHGDIIPLRDFRQEFKAVYNCFMIAAFAYHYQRSMSGRELARRVDVSAPMVAYYRGWFSKVKENSPMDALFDQFDRWLLADEPRSRANSVGRAFGPFIARLFPIYMGIINGRKGLPDLKEAHRKLYERYEKAYVWYALEQSERKLVTTATGLRVSRPALDRSLRKYDVKKRYV